MAEFNWIITANDVKIDDQGLKNVVTAIHWRHTATDGEYFVDAYGCAAVGEPAPADFTDYASLTKEQEVSWLEETLDVPSMQASLEAQVSISTLQQIQPLCFTDLLLMVQLGDQLLQ